MKNWVKSPQDFAAFFLEWAVPVEIKMDHVTWLWMQLGHLKSGTEDGSITVLSLRIFQPRLMTPGRLWAQKPTRPVRLMVHHAE